MEIVVKVTQNWSFESVKIRARMVLSMARIWMWFFSLLVRENSVAEWWNSGPEFTSRKYNINVFLGSDLFQFYEGYFYYKYRPCIRVNLEIEGVETRV